MARAHEFSEQAKQAAVRFFAETLKPETPKKQLPELSPRPKRKLLDRLFRR